MKEVSKYKIRDTEGTFVTNSAGPTEMMKGHMVRGAMLEFQGVRWQITAVEHPNVPRRAKEDPDVTLWEWGTITVREVSAATPGAGSRTPVVPQPEPA